MRDKFLELLTMIRKFFKKWWKIISAAVYMILVFVVVYGISIGVYDGFPVFVPYLVMAVFIVMAFTRVYEWAMSLERSTDAFDEDDGGEIGEDEPVAESREESDNGAQDSSR